jgi:hypothetical protein
MSAQRSQETFMFTTIAVADPPGGRSASAERAKTEEAHSQERGEGWPGGVLTIRAERVVAAEGAGVDRREEVLVEGRHLAQLPT